MGTPNLALAIEKIRRMELETRGLAELAELLNKVQSLEAYTGELEVTRDKIIQEIKERGAVRDEVNRNFSEEIEKGEARVAELTDQGNRIVKAAEDRAADILSDSRESAKDEAAQIVQNANDEAAQIREGYIANQGALVESNKQLEALEAEKVKAETDTVAAQAAFQRVMQSLEDIRNGAFTFDGAK